MLYMLTLRCHVEVLSSGSRIGINRKSLLYHDLVKDFLRHLIVLYRYITCPLRESGGMPPGFLGEFWPSEIISGAIWG